MLAGFPDVPIILLIDAVKFQEFVVVIRKTRRNFVSERLRNRPAKQGTALFQTFISRKLGCFGRNHKLSTQVNKDYAPDTSKCQLHFGTGLVLVKWGE